MQSKFTQCVIFIAALLFASPFVLNAQSNQVFTLTATDLQNGKQIALDKLQWKYHAGDDLNWANPNFDDSAWETLKDAALTRASLPQTGWNGIGWFRLRLNAAPELAGISLNLETVQLGASEIYLDGKLIKRYGTIGNTPAGEVPYNPNAEPLGIVFDVAGEHLLAVRYSNQAAADVNSGYGKWLLGNGTLQGGAGGIGFAAQIKKFDDTANQGWNLGFSFAYLTVQATVFFSFFILHLLLFVLYPRQRGNLYFSIFLINITLNNVFGIALTTYHNGTVVYYWCYLLFYFTLVFCPIALLAFLYSDFERRIPRYIWIFIGLTALCLLQFAFFRDAIAAWLYSILNLAVGIEATRIMVRAIRRRMPDAWIIGIGIFLFDIYILREAALSLQLVELPTNIYLFTDISGIYGLLLSITIYLARQFSRTSTNLDAQLVKEVEHERAASQLALEREQEKARFSLVEAENERRAKELEEARQLQLSMLPKKLPQIEGLEIAAYMKPATEVGGDYYDFHEGEDGILTIAVGDATGHGLKAGTVVTATKGLFNNLAAAPDIPHTLRQISGALKAMNLRGLFMAMTLLKIKDNQVNLSIAGMPAALIYRAESRTVEEISIRAMPLGSLTKFNYQNRRLALFSGDVIVVMSDGFPEMFNQQNEILGFEKASEILPQIAMNSPQEIINRLIQTSEDWADGRPQDDDVTFVVLKIGSDGK